MRWLGPDPVSVDGAHWGLTDGFLLQNSVVCTVESLSLFYLLFISWFICSMRWLMDKLGIFHANKTSLCIDPCQNEVWGWYHETSQSPPVIFLLTVPSWCFFVDLFSYLLLSSVMSVPCSLVVTCWEKADLLTLMYVMFSRAFVTFPYGVLCQVLDLFGYLRLSSVMSVSCSLVVTCWERVDLLTLMYVIFSCAFVTFPNGVLCQVFDLLSYLRLSSVMSVSCSLVVTCLERVDLLTLVLLSLSNMVSFVRCGTWLYWFLIFAFPLLCIGSSFCSWCPV